MKILVMGAVCLLFILLAGPTRAQTIGLFSDTDCSSCALDVPVGETRTIYVVGPLTGFPVPQLFAGTDFRITGLPVGWTYSVSAPGGVLFFGDPFATTGVVTSHNAAPSSLCHIVLIIQITATTDEEDVTLWVAGSNPPQRPDLQCPVIVRFDGALIFLLCANGGQLLINSQSNCQVSIESMVWGAVKALYR